MYHLPVAVRNERTRRVFDEMRDNFDTLHDDYFLASATIEDVDGETEQASDSASIVSAESASSRTTHVYIEDITDMQRVAYPISEAGFQEFVRWRSLRRDWDRLLQTERRHHENNDSKDEEDWPSYLKDVLQVAALPRLAATSSTQRDRGKRRMNNDIAFLFTACDASDVLHVLVSNWHHYAHLIEIQDASKKRKEKELQELRDNL